MYWRTDTRWLYWSRGEASFLAHHWKMRIENWTMLAYSEVFLSFGIRFIVVRVLKPGAFGFKVRTCALPTSFIRMVLLATCPTLRISFLLSRFALLGIFLFFLFQLFAVFDHLTLFFAVVANYVLHLPSGKRSFGRRG